MIVLISEKPRMLLRFFLLTILITCIAGAASAEIARVATPGGPVKMRVKPSAKGKLVTSIPNNTFILLDEAGEEWCHVTYKNKSGYVMTKFLITASELEQSGPEIACSPQTPVVGGIVDFTVHAQGAAAYQYAISYIESKAIKGEKVPYAAVSFRPRQAGFCCLEATVWYEDGTSETGMRFLEIEEADASDTAENISDGFVMYSQKDGWWLGQKYGSSTLDASGCAIFTLSHALQLMGHSTDEERPENLAKRYAFCLVDGGTLNSTLIGRSAKHYKYQTKADLIHSEKDIASRLENGALFTFSIVQGHIALVSGLSEDGTKARIIDSAPSVTLERITNARLYSPAADGSWQAIEELSDIPGARFYFETNQFGGMTYYLDLSYVAKRGVRLIQAEEAE